MKFFKLIFFFMLSSVAASADWKSIGDGFYINAGSIKKSGELTHAYFKAPGVKYDVLFYIDCKRRIVINPENNKEYTFKELPQIANSEGIVCKSSIFNLFK